MLFHGLSHATASLVCIISADAIGGKLVSALPILHTIILEWMDPIVEYYDWNLSQHQIAEGITLIVLTFFWGVAFYWLRPGKETAFPETFVN